MTDPEDLTGAVCASLSALADHVASLPAPSYAEQVADLGGASIGQHVRHCLEHYATLAKGIATGRFDYDDRSRSIDIEGDRDCAVQMARSLLADLRANLCEADLSQAVHVRCASSCDGEVPWQPSSLGRELQFVVGHTVHHAAMIAASCRARGLSVATDHGVAPSTLRHRKSVRAPH